MIKEMYIQSLYKTLKKIEEFKNAPNESIAVISDFTGTLTYSNIVSIMEILRTHEEVWYNKKRAQEYFREALELKDKYLPIENDVRLSLQEKRKYMEEWWNKVYELMIKYEFEKDIIYKAVDIGIKKNKIKLRDGVEEYLHILNKENIPLVVISSQGLGKIAIESILDKHDLLLDNTYILGNEIIFDKNGKMIDYKKPPITSMNKYYINLEEYPQIHEALKGKEHVIVIGEKIEDVNLRNLIDHKNYISIGFISNTRESLVLRKYMENYDIVLNGESSFDPLTDMIKYVLNRGD